MGAMSGQARGIPMQQQQDGKPRARLLEEAALTTSREVGTVADALAASGVRRDKNRAGCPRFTVQTGDGDLDSKFSVLISRTAKIPKGDVKRLRTSGCIMQVPAPRLASPPTPPTPSRPSRVPLHCQSRPHSCPPALRVFETLQPRASEPARPSLVISRVPAASVHQNRIHVPCLISFRCKPPPSAGTCAAKQSGGSGSSSSGGSGTCNPGWWLGKVIPSMPLDPSIHPSLCLPACTANPSPTHHRSRYYCGRRSRLAGPPTPAPTRPTVAPADPLSTCLPPRGAQAAIDNRRDTKMLSSQVRSRVSFESARHLTLGRESEFHDYLSDPAPGRIHNAPAPRP
ncbi:hypothetical protein PCL_05481 [Purpureocillium lilacinum]|uniref:Uncharacterized protein n=1 Tax=Purpureocillium lilacinum TaxID=33203 RepID=A0A2U3DUR7_PURLI|nr:hypothetical protein PCL_05481 [Purpureocillium lilacinum]